jgi:hypothetical protein
MTAGTHRELANFIWSICNLLREASWKGQVSTPLSEVFRDNQRKSLAECELERDSKSPGGSGVETCFLSPPMSVCRSSRSPHRLPPYQVRQWQAHVHRGEPSGHWMTVRQFNRASGTTGFNYGSTTRRRGWGGKCSVLTTARPPVAFEKFSWNAPRYASTEVRSAVAGSDATSTNTTWNTRWL